MAPATSAVFATEAPNKVNSGIMVDVEKIEKTQLKGEELRNALKKQLEFYFSKENLATDSYMISNMKTDLSLPIEFLASFKLVRALTDDINLIVDVLRSSKEVIVDPTGQYVKPNIKVPRTTVILRDMPSDVPEEEIRGIFTSAGCPEIKSIKPDIQDTWFVTFETESDAVDSLFAIQKQTFRGNPVRARIKSENLLKSFYNPLAIPVANGQGAANAAPTDAATAAGGSSAFPNADPSLGDGSTYAQNGYPMMNGYASQNGFVNGQWRGYNTYYDPEFYQTNRGRRAPGAQNNYRARNNTAQPNGAQNAATSQNGPAPTGGSAPQAAAASTESSTTGGSFSGGYRGERHSGQRRDQHGFAGGRSSQGGSGKRRSISGSSGSRNKQEPVALGLDMFPPLPGSNPTVPPTRPIESTLPKKYSAVTSEAPKKEPPKEPHHPKEAAAKETTKESGEKETHAPKPNKKQESKPQQKKEKDHKQAQQPAAEQVQPTTEAKPSTEEKQSDAASIATSTAGLSYAQILKMKSAKAEEKKDKPAEKPDIKKDAGNQKHETPKSDAETATPADASATPSADATAPGTPESLLPKAPSFDTPAIETEAPTAEVGK